MAVLLIGAICAFAAFQAARPDGLPGRRAFACAAGITALVLAQVWIADGAIRQYRIALLGMRYALAEPGVGLLDDTLRVGGDYDAADLYVNVPGDRDVARVWAQGDSARTTVLVSQTEDVQAVVAVEGKEALHIAGARRFGPGDTVVVARPTAFRLTFTRGRRVLPWREEHAVRDERGRRVVLPPARLGWRDALADRRLGPFQRTYPLADVLAQLDSAADVGDLSSFFFYDEGRLSFVDLDSEVQVQGAAQPATDTVWTTGGGDRRLVVAGLPFRDQPEPELEGPERYGLRTLLSGRVHMEGQWLDFYLSSPEIRSFGREDLGQLSLDTRTRRAGCGGREAVFRVHVSPVRQTYSRRAVTFSAPPRRFESASQAVLSLPCSFAPGTLGVLSPSGTIRAETGLPFSLGDGRREVLMRVDAKRLDRVGLLLTAGLLLLPSILLLWLPAAPAVRALAVAALGLAAIRLLLGFSTGVEYPYLQEANQTGLWMAPVLPWAVLAAGTRGQPRRATDPWLHAAYALLVMAVTPVLFVDSMGKTAVLGAVPPLVWLVAHAGLVRDAWRRRRSSAGWIRVAIGWLRGRRMAARRLARGAPRWVRAAGHRLGWWYALWPGFFLGSGLLGLRFILALTGNNEALRVGTTRVGLSVFYTPLSLFLLVEVVRRHELHLRGGDGEPRSPATVVLDVWGYVFLAFVVVAGLVSDLGLALTTLPGVLVFLLLAGDRWTAATPAVAAAGSSPAGLRSTAGVRAALALPLVLFVLVQLQPRIPLEAGDASQPHFRMQEWKTSQLRLLEFGDPAALQLIGQRRSEALGAMSETMHAYTRGPLAGAGYFMGEVSPELRATAAQEHAVSALVVGQWGWLGAVGLVLALCALLGPVAVWWRTATPTPSAGGLPSGLIAALGLLVLLALSSVLPLSGVLRPVSLLIVGVVPVVLALASAHRGAVATACASPPLSRTATASALFLLTIALAGLYMVLANYGMALFTGKNVYVLGLDSVGDVLESLVLFTGAALWLPGGGTAMPRPGGR